jgi:hypothetical protein
MLQPISTELKKLKEDGTDEGVGEGRERMSNLAVWVEDRISTMLLLSKLVVTEWPDSSCVSPPPC